MDAAVCRAEVCYPFGRAHGRHRAVRRREFITLLGGTAVGLPLTAGAQQPAMPVIGFLSAYPHDSFARHILAAFRRGLNELGYFEGRNVAIEYRWSADEYDQIGRAHV